MSKPRASVADLVVALGLVQFVVDAHTVEETESKKAGKFKNCCPTCHAAGKAVLVRNTLECDEGHPVDGDTILKGQYDDNGDLSIVGTKEEVAEIKSESSLIKKRLDLTPVDADEVDRYLFAGDGFANVLLPKGNTETYHVLLSIMDDAGRIVGDDKRERVLVGPMLGSRGGEYVVRLQKWNGKLVLKSMLRPESIKEFPDLVAPELSKGATKMARTLVEQLTEEFDPANFRDENRERLNAWVAARRSGVTVDPPKASAKAADTDMEAMLAAAVAAAKAKAS